MKWFWIVIAAAAAATLLVVVSVGGMMGPGMMSSEYEHAIPAASNGWAWPAMMGAGWLMMFGLWATFGVVLFLLVRAASERSSQTNSGLDAMEILRRRYAAGQIDEETYDRQRQKLAA